MRHATVIAQVQEWLEKAVIGLNLCPFANAVHIRQQIHYVVSDAKDEKALTTELELELRRLHDADVTEVETTLLIHPNVLNEFLAYNQFLQTAETSLRKLDLDGTIQIASFHPDYQFADGDADDIENFTNRSPFPILHLLREGSVEKAVASYPDTDLIFERNKQTMRRLGLRGWRDLKIPGKNS